MIDKFIKIAVFLIIPAVSGGFGLKPAQNATQATTEPTATASAEVAEPPSTPKPFNEREYIVEVFGKDANIALAIAQAESGIQSKRSNTMNRNGTYDWGIFQVNDCHCKKVEGDCHEKLLDPKFNIEFAKRIFDDSGWYPWSTYNNGAYKRHL